MCARLGVRQAWSQAYRPQANGRAEVAGRTVMAALRKLQADHEINWVEGLPRVLRLMHDLPDPETGVSPYQLVFGRERSLGGLPYLITRSHPEAEEFFDGIAKLDEFALKFLQKSVYQQELALNKRRPMLIDFKVGEWVFVQRPTAYAGPKMQTSWMGPYQLVARTGEHSFTVHINPKVAQEVHWDQIKKCISHPDIEKLYPTVYRRGEPIVSIPEANIKKILDTEWDDDGLHFLVEWTEGVGGSKLG